MVCINANVALSSMHHLLCESCSCKIVKPQTSTFVWIWCCMILSPYILPDWSSSGKPWYMCVYFFILYFKLKILTNSSSWCDLISHSLSTLSTSHTHAHAHAHMHMRTLQNGEKPMEQNLHRLAHLWKPGLRQLLLAKICVQLCYVDNNGFQSGAIMTIAECREPCSCPLMKQGKIT